MSKYRMFLGDNLQIFDGDQQHRKLMIALLVTYIASIFNKTVYAVVLSEIKNDFGLDNDDLAGIALLNATAYVFGKASLGFVIDSIDARRAIWGLVFMASLSVFFMSFARDMSSLNVFVWINCYCFSGIWPAINKCIYHWFDPAAYEKVFIWVRLIDEIGSFLSMFVLGWVMRQGASWNAVLRLAALLQAIPMLISMRILDRPAPPKSEDLYQRVFKGSTRGGTCRAIGKWVRNKRFWCIVAFMAMLSVGNHLEQYATIWIVDVYRPCMNTTLHNPDGALHCASRISAGTASLFVSLISVGIFSSLLFGLYFLNEVSIQLSARVSVAMCWGCFVSGIAMLCWTLMIEENYEAPTSYTYPLAFIFVFFGFCLGFPLFIPTSVYVIRSGGDHAATLSALLDLLIFIVAGTVTLLGTRLSEKGSFITPTSIEKSQQYTPTDLVADVTPSFELERRSGWRFNFMLFSASMLLSVIAFTKYWRLEITSLAKDNMANYVDSWLEKRASARHLFTRGKPEDGSEDPIHVKM